MLSCSIINLAHHHSKFKGGRGLYVLTVRAPRPSYLLIQKGTTYNDVPPPDVDWKEWYKEGSAEAEIVSQIEQALRALLPDDMSVFIEACAELIEIQPQWQQKFIETLYEANTHNQDLSFAEGKPLHTWNNLRFRSQTEIRVAQALERAQVLFLPNCMARLGFSQRQNREADFLVWHKGKWGILEVDSPSSHPPNADKQVAVLQTRLEKSRAAEMLYGFALSIRALLLGLTPSAWSAQPYGYVSVGVGIALMIGAVMFKVREQ